MTAHVTLPPRRSPSGGQWWIALCSCGHKAHGDTDDEARTAIKAHKAEALGDAEATA